MPHILTQKSKEPSFPFSSGEFEFIYKVDNSHESLIKCRYEDRFFYLKDVKKADKSLIKLDKISRISPISIQKEAILSYAKSLNETYLFSNINTENKKEQKVSPFLYTIDKFIDDFETAKEIWIDVGFGSGRHLLHEAKKNPNIQFIGIEIHKPSIEQVLKQIELQNLTNIIIISYDARLLLEFIKSNGVGRIFVHFPVPWDKKPHRRVIREDFIEESLRVLKPNGTLELRTDSDNYFEYATELFHRYKDDAKVTSHTNQELEISSKYEDRWKRQNKNIYDLTLTNNLLSKEKSHESLGESFDVGSDFLLQDKIIKQENVFVHFERLYENDKMKVLKLSFGDTSKCEHQYLEIKDGKATFFPNKPIPFDANIEACRIIKEVING